MKVPFHVDILSVRIYHVIKNIVVISGNGKAFQLSKLKSI